jgi:hypothetical protein
MKYKNRMFTDVSSCFPIARWWKRPWLWFKRLIGRGEVIVINGESFRVKRVASSTQIEVK